MAFREKKDLLLEYDPDVLIIQECENPETKGEWDEFSDWRWIGDNDNKGLGVFCRNGLNFESTSPQESESRYALPVRISEGLNILGIWAMNDEENPRQRYISQVYTAVQDYREFLDSNAVVAGDFNWNIIWDKSPDAPLRANFLETVDELSDIGLVSSYHRLTGSRYGGENSPTFFMHKKQDRDYHTDYLFIPKKLVHHVKNLKVGSFQDWIDLSDHMPIIVDIDN
jgi:exonuclease III